MPWIVLLRESVIGDLRWLGRKEGRLVIREADKRLRTNPLTETRNLKVLRPNRVAQRELRLFGKYRVLFDVDPAAKVVTIGLVGEKRGDVLFVQGKEFSVHHEGDSTE